MNDSAPKQWRRSQHNANYLISTDSTLLSHEFINQAFSSKEMYWAKPLPAQDLNTLLSASLTLGLYLIIPPSMPNAGTASDPSSPRASSPTISEPESPSMDIPDLAFAAATARAKTPPPEPERLQMIGIARFVTDHVTTMYLTDVYVAPEHRGSGLGKWLVGCCGEVIEGAPHLRRALLMASPGEGQKFYEKALGMRDLGDEREHVVGMTTRKFDV